MSKRPGGGCAARRRRLPGHYVVAHFGGAEPLLLDPFNGGVEVTGDAPAALVRPWSPHETAMRMLNDLVPAFQKRGDFIARFAPRSCGSRFQQGPTSATACAPSSPRSAPGSTEPARTTIAPRHIVLAGSVVYQRGGRRL